MSEERNQVFRGDVDPEYGFAEPTAESRQQPSAPAPEQDRALQETTDRATAAAVPDDLRHHELFRHHTDASEGPSNRRELRDTSAAGHSGDVGQQEVFAPASLDAGSRDGPGISRQLFDAAGAALDARSLLDSAVQVAPRDGATQHGPSDPRQLRDSHGAVAPGTAPPADVPLGSAAAPGANPEAVAATVAATNTGPAAPADGVSDPDLNFTDRESMTPWALSIHLQERIAGLGETTARVNQQLEALEASTKRLGKRIQR